MNIVAVRVMSVNFEVDAFRFNFSTTLSYNLLKLFREIGP